MRTTAAIALLISASVGCRSTPDNAAFERMLRAHDVRCLAVEERFVLYSPFDAARTQRFVAAAKRALDELEAGFGVALADPLVVALLPRTVQGPVPTVEDDVIRFEGAPSRPSEGGLLGVAGSDGARDAVAVYVAADRQHVLPDGRTLTETFAFEGELDTLRHELAHVVAARAGVVGPQWLDEGLAHLFEHGRLVDGTLVTDRDAPSLARARTRFERTSLSLLLAWEETPAGAARGEVFHAGRPLAHALVLFLFERDEGPVPARIRRIAARSDAELLALEPEFRAWMEAGMPAP